MQQRAGFGIRLAAAAIDGAAMYCLNFIATAVILPAMAARQRAGIPAPQATTVISLVLLITAVCWLSYAAFELVGPASPAKRLLKLRIVSAADHEPAPFFRRARRWGIKYLPVVLYLASTAALYHWIRRAEPPPVWLIGLLALCGLSVFAVLGGFFATLGKDRRAVHDYLGGTAVVKPVPVPEGFAPIMAQPVNPATSFPPPAGEGTATP
jgi:uncharacterized RDD family membrane protein YckC